MKCRRVSLDANVEKYEYGKGMEDGFEKWSKVVTQGWIVTDFLIKNYSTRRQYCLSLYKESTWLYFYRRR